MERDFGDLASRDITEAITELFRLEKHLEYQVQPSLDLLSSITKPSPSLPPDSTSHFITLQVQILENKYLSNDWFNPCYLLFLWLKVKKDNWET